MKKHLRQPGDATAFLAAAFVALAIAASAVYWSAMDNKQAMQREAAHQRNALRAGQLNAAVTQQLDATLRSVDIALKHLRSVYLQNPDDFDRAAHDVMAAYPAGMLEYVTVFGEAGQLLYVSTRRKPGAASPSFADREHFRVHADGGSDTLFISAPLIGRIAGVPLVQLTRGMWKHGRFQGVIGVPLRPDYLSNHLLSLRVDPSDILAVVRTDGSTIARSHNLAEALKSRLPPDRPFFKAQAGESGLFSSTSTFDKLPVLFSWQRLKDWPLITVAAINEQTELAPLTLAMAQERLHTALTMALLIVSSLGLSLLVVRTQRQKVALALSEARHRTLFEHSKIPMLLIQPEDGAIADANRAALAFYGYDRPTMLQMRIADFNQLSPAQIEAEMALAAQEQRSCFHFPHRLSSGEIRQVEVHSGPIEVDGRVLLYSFIHDITERTQLEDQVRRLAFHDALTGLPNRRLLQDRLAQTQANNKRNGHYAALMFLDLDNFKPLNDLHGHDMGDLLLVEVARRLCACVREMDTVARFGGDEFVVMLSALGSDPQEAATQAHTVAEKIRLALAEPYHLSLQHGPGATASVTHACSASVGLTLFCDHPGSGEDLLSQADGAMYAAKEAGRNRIRQYGYCDYHGPAHSTQ